MTQRKGLPGLSEEVASKSTTLRKLADVVVIIVLLGIIVSEDLLLPGVFRAKAAIRRGNVELTARVTVRIQALCFGGDRRTKRDVVILGVSADAQAAGTDPEEGGTDHLSERCRVNRSQTKVIARHRVRVVQALPRDSEAVDRGVAQLEPERQRRQIVRHLPSLGPERTGFAMLARGEASNLLSLVRQVCTDRAFPLTRISRELKIGFQEVEVVR